ncbi:MAG: ABC transporter ATP-binding protein [Xanthomonadales bacterium]|nr:ABC transporter ATP-binding protein [Xanthomonadales bacterium]
MYLEIKDVHVDYGKVRALKGISIGLEKGSIVTLIGPNGAGKSTTLRAISGLVRPSQGEIYFDGKRIDRARPDSIVRMGIAHVPEGRHVFPDLTVYENLQLGAFTRNDKVAVKNDLESIFEYFEALRPRARQMAKTMSGGEQQMMVIGRALMSNPKVLLLDEPSLGLAPVIVQNIARILAKINKERGVSVVLVEQNAEIALQLSQYAYVLELGGIALHGEASGLRGNEHVRKAYLGM